MIKITNAPKRIWLQVGDIEEDRDFMPFGEIDRDAITWEDERIYDSDVAYVRADILHTELFKTALHGLLSSDSESEYTVQELTQTCMSIADAALEQLETRYNHEHED